MSDEPIDPTDILPPPPPEDGFPTVNIEDEVRSSFLAYSMSVIISRALPDVRDGLKPVHRRILYAMQQEGLLPNRPYSKSAGVVGEVLKHYHPHGDSAVYDSMVRMAQDFSLRYPLVDGQGNFGSIDGDSAAAYRYTEARLARLAEEMLRDIDRETVDLPAAGTVTHSVACTIEASAVGEHELAASVSAAALDPDNSNNRKAVDVVLEPRQVCEPEIFNDEADGRLHALIPTHIALDGVDQMHQAILVSPVGQVAHALDDQIIAAGQKACSGVIQIITSIQKHVAQTGHDARAVVVCGRR